ncbi:MAG: hypothetical protein UD961_10690 [Bacteroidales bacterium]|nr:hypothetical protein [Bacteroidales bacterium]
MTISKDGFADVLDDNLKELCEDDYCDGIEEKNHYNYGQTSKE